MIQEEEEIASGHTNDIPTHLIVWNFSDVAHIVEVCRDATSDSSTEQTSLNKALLCSSHSLSTSLCLSLSLSSQSASLVSFSLSALLFSPQLSILLYCLWKLK
jgi:hypothetical protein